MAAAQTAWRCSQCGTINEPGSRACAGCGKWPSLFDLQDGAVEEPDVQDDAQPLPFEEMVVREPETFEQVPAPEPEVFEAPELDESAETKPRVARWAVTAIWVIGLAVWLLVNAVFDSN